MGNLKKFLSNKNTVTVLGVVLAVVVLYIGYNMRVRSAINPIVVPYAKQTISPGTQITSDMVGTMEVPPAMLKGDVITNSGQVIDKYSNDDSIIPEGSLFYGRSVVEKENLTSAGILDYPNGYVLYNMSVNSSSTYGNSIFPGNYIDIYLKAVYKVTDETNITSDADRIMLGKLIENVKIEAENLRKQQLIEAKEEVLKIRNELDQEIRERRGDVQAQERRLIQKEENLEKRATMYDSKEKELERKVLENEAKKQELEELYAKQLEELQRISGLSEEQAKAQLLNDLDKEITQEKAAKIREIEAKTKEDSQKIAREIVGFAIQKCAADHTSETTLSVVSLPNDEMKGRIIGREGRNIKALETLTGIDLIIDDTPEAVIISGFDPLRREVARRAIEKLIDDGRIHPAKIEEMVEKAKEEIEADIKAEGERAALETGVNNLHPDIIKLIGKLKYRTSYGQNVLNHSIEVSNLARIMADEIGVNSKIARRASC